MRENVTGIFLGLLAFCLGVVVLRVSQKGHVPRWLKQRRLLSGESRYDISDETARAIGLLIGIGAMIVGLTVLFINFAIAIPAIVDYIHAKSAG